VLLLHTARATVRKQLRPNLSGNTQRLQARLDAPPNVAALEV
jgi:hypothetical protein